jgi:hypothetical protein
MTKTPLAVHAYIQCTHACSYTTYMPLCKKQANSQHSWHCNGEVVCIILATHLSGDGAQGDHVTVVLSETLARPAPIPVGVATIVHTLQFAPSLSCTLCLVLRVRVPPGTLKFCSWMCIAYRFLLCNSM